jgi:hypothetical protein
MPFIVFSAEPPEATPAGEQRRENICAYHERLLVPPDLPGIISCTRENGPNSQFYLPVNLYSDDLAPPAVLA